MNPKDTMTVAVEHCPALDTKSLEDFLDGLLDEDLDTLAQMPGTPGQVMAAQFTHYVRSSVALTESWHRDKAQSQKLIDTVMRLPWSNKRAKTLSTRRATADGSDSSRLQTSAA